MTDYSNPQVMKAVEKEAREAGIFNKKLNIKNQYHIFTLKVSAKDSLTLDMFCNNKNYGYKLRQVDFISGLNSLYKPKRIYINFIKRTLFRYKYEIRCLMETKSESERAWDKIQEMPLKFFFENKDGFIEVISPINAKFKIMEVKENSK